MRSGVAEKAGPDGRKTPNDRLPRQGNRGETITPAQEQSLTNATPKVKQRAKQIRISHLNCNKSRLAIDELILVRSRDDILLITEPPITDGITSDLEGYTTISGEGETVRTCIYIKDNSMRYTSEHKAKDYTTSLRLSNGRLVKCIYSPPDNDNRNPDVYETFEEGEVRMGDFNATHPTWHDGCRPNTEGRKLKKWMDTKGVRERGPNKATHDKGNKLDLIITKDNSEYTTVILRNGRIEHSDHRCQSIKITITSPDPKTEERRTNYRKMEIYQLTEDIKKMSLGKPENPNQLIEQLETIRKTLPTKTIRERPRKSAEVLNSRRNLQRAIRKGHSGILEIRELRLKYRQALRDHNNDKLSKTLDDTNEENRFFEISKRGTTKKAIPPLTVEGITYNDHRGISQALANHHSATPEKPAQTNNPTHYDEETTQTNGKKILAMKGYEVAMAIEKAATDSTIGEDDIGKTLLRAYHKANPEYIEDVFTTILKTGKHPRQ